MAVLHPNTYKAIIAICDSDIGGAALVASGFFLHDSRDKDHIYLVTATDAVFTDGELKPEIYVAGGSEEKPFKLALVDCVINSALNEDVLIAVLKITTEVFDKYFSTFYALQSAIALDDLETASVTEGDMVLIPSFLKHKELDLGFPIVRGGIIARIKPVYERKHSCFLVDAELFAGNVGSPVLLRPWPFRINGQPSYDQPLIIGVVVDWLNREREGPPKQKETAALGYVAPAAIVNKLLDQLIVTNAKPLVGNS